MSDTFYINGTWYTEDEEGDRRPLSSYELQTESLICGCE